MKKITLLIVSVLGMTALAGCAGEADDAATVESVAFICGIGSTANVERFAGVIESGSETKVEKDGEKKIEEILVKVGDTVTKDQPLFRYDKAQTELSIQKTRIEIEQLNGSAASKRSEIETLEKEIAGGQLDADTKTSYTLQIQELNADVTETNLSVKSKQAELDNLQNTLNNLEVKSPDEGTIQSINNDENSQDSAFITIRKTSAFRVKGYVNETNRGSLYEGMDVLIRSRVDDALQKGSIKSIDLKNPAQSNSNDMFGSEGDDTASSSKYPFYIELEKTDGFIIGQHVYIEPDYGQGDLSEESMMLPAYYINEANTTPWVWARDSKERLEKRTLTLGTYDSDMDAYEVKGGLEGSDFIAAPDDSLKAGMKCVEFDFTSDMPMNMDGDFTFTEDDMEMSEPTGGAAPGGAGPAMMSPFLPAPGISGGADEMTEEGEEENAPEEPSGEDEGEVQKD